MESRVKVLGHPMHTILVPYPLALLQVGVAMDLIYLLTGNQDFAGFAFWAIGIGVVVGLAAILFGVIDYKALPADTRAKRIGRWHGLGNGLVVALFALSWFLRTPDASYSPNLVPFLLALAGAGLTFLTAWLGGELVYRLRVGVDEGAGLDAPSSLTS